MNDWRVVSVGIAGVLLIALAWTSAWREHQCESARNQWKTKPPVPTACVCSEEAAKHEHDTNNPAPQCDWPEMTVQWATFWALVATLLAIIWQAKATADSADAAKSSAETARDALVAVQRAFVAKTTNFSIRFMTMTEADGTQAKQATFDFELSNSGTTPAIDVISRMTVMRSETLPSHDDILGPPAEHGIGYIAPKGTYNLQFTKPVIETFGFDLTTPPAQGAPVVVQMLSGSVYVVGWIAYRDIFERPHVTQFCCSLTKIAYGLPSMNLLWTWSDVGSRCGVDEACPNYTAIVAKLPPRSPILPA